MRADAEGLPFASGAFDRAVCLCALQNFGEPDAALRELGRVMAVGGVFGLSVDSLLAPRWVSAEYRAYHRTCQQLTTQLGEVTPRSVLVELDALGTRVCGLAWPMLPGLAGNHFAQLLTGSAPSAGR